MLILNQEILDNNEQINNILTNEKKIINTAIETQNGLKHILLDYMQKLADSTDNVESQYADIILSLLNDFKNSLELFKINIDLLNTLSKLLDTFELNINNKIISSETINIFNNTFIESNNTVFQNTLKIETVLQSVLKYLKLTFIDSNTSIFEENNEKNFFEEHTSEISSELLNDNSNESQSEQLDNNCISQNKSENFENSELVENTLIISEKKGKIFLPYTLSLLNDILMDNPEKYSSIEDVIEKEFTLPFESFKNPAIARFREAFKLIRKKEKESVKDAFDLGMELLFNYDLHPAIISGCKNIDELDIYLDYLETNEIDKFDCFKIVFDVAPVVVKSKKS